MAIISKTLTIASLLWTSALHAQHIHWGVDGMLGIHYNTLNAASYKTPVGDIAAGVHVTLSDPDDYSRPVYFNGRLSFGNDFQTCTVFGDTKLDCSLRDLVCSFQAHKDLTEHCSVYAGINLSLNVINTIWLRSEGNAFSALGQRAEAIEAMVREKVRRFNAGLEAGCMYPLGKGFKAGLHLTYYVLPRLNEDLKLGAPGASEQVALNFSPLALRLLCTFEL